MELLPAERDIRIHKRRDALTERVLHAHDAAIIACPDQNTESALKSLPYGQLWLKLYRDAAKSGAPRHLSARLGPHATPVTLLFAKSSSAAFERLTSAGRAWKELGAPVKANVLLVTHAVDARQSAQILESLLAAGLAWSAPLPHFKSKKVDRAKLAGITLIGEGAALDIERTRAIDRGNHVARWLTTLPPNVLDTLAYRRALRSLARERGWRFTFYDDAALRRAGAGAFLAVARANEHRGAGIARLRYRPSQRTNAPKIALVGKGICFDTGGINVKTDKGM